MNHPRNVIADLLRKRIVAIGTEITPEVAKAAIAQLRYTGRPAAVVSAAMERGVVLSASEAKLYGLVSGSVAYDPDPLDPPAEGNVLTCCSRPRGDVVIDI